MIVKLGDISFRVIKICGEHCIQMLCASSKEWKFVEPSLYIADIVDAAYIMGKRAVRDELRTKLGLND